MSTLGFLEVQLDPSVSYGSKGSPGYTTTVVKNPNPKETRFPQASRGYLRREIVFKDRTVSQMNSIRSVFQAAQGKNYGWRFRDWREYYTCTDNYVSRTIGKEPITTYVGGTTMQLIHTRNPAASMSGPLPTGTPEIVLIRKPDLNLATTGAITPAFGTTVFQLFRDGSSTPWANTNYTLDVTTGIVTFTADQTGHTFEWIGIWDTPCRFDVDDMDDEWIDFDDAQWESIKVMEITV